MQTLLPFIVIGALFGLVVGIVLSVVAVPAYSEYVMPLGVYNDLPLTGAFGRWLASMEPWLLWLALPAFLWLWWRVAGTLNPIFKQFPFARDGRPAWAATAWLVAGVLYVVQALAWLWMSDIGMAGSASSVRAIQWLIPPLLTAVVWIMLSPQAFGRFEAGTTSFSWRGVWRAAGLGVIFMAVCMVAIAAIGKAYVAGLTLVVEAIDQSSEVTWFGMASSVMILVILFALGYGIVYGLLPAFVPGAGTWRERMNKVCPALALLVVALLLGAAALPVFARAHYFNPQLVDVVTGLKDLQPVSLWRVKLCADSNCRADVGKTANPQLKASELPNRILTGGMMMVTGGTAPLHPAAPALLEKFLAGEGKFSVLRKSAMSAAIDVQRDLWAPADARSQIGRFLEQGELRNGSIMWTQQLLIWLENGAPLNAETRSLLETLSDEKRYFIGSRGAARLALAWARFGDMNRAHQFLEKARQGSPGKFDHVKTVRNDLASGRVTGRITLPTGARGVRVGLFRMTADPLNKPNAAEKRRPDGGPLFQSTSNLARMTEAVTLDDSGRFEFHDLGAGDYYLALLIPGEKLGGKDRLGGQNVPDLIALNAKHPRADLGEIRLVPQDKTDPASRGR